MKRREILPGKLQDKVRANATIDSTTQESARAKLIVLVRRHSINIGIYPTSNKRVIETVLKQAELIADGYTII